MSGVARKRQRQPEPRAKGRRPRPGVWVTVAGLLLVHWLLAVTSLRDKSATFDEVVHLTNGYIWWTHQDLRMIPDHPPFGPAWAASPLLADDLSFPSHEQDAWYHSKHYTIAKQFFYQSGNDPVRMLRQARRMCVLLSVMTGLVVFLWSRRLFGDGGGLLSLSVYALSPTVLANGRLITTDIAATLFFLLATGGIWWVLHRVNWWSLGLSAAAVGGLFLSKMSAALIVPIGLLLLVVRLVDGRPLVVALGRRARELRGRLRLVGVMLAVMGIYVVVTWGLIWGAYGFRYEAMVDAQPGRDHLPLPGDLPAGKTVWEHQARGIPAVGAGVTWARRHRLLPEAYLYSFLSAMQGARGRDAFLEGERRLTGFADFFPRCFLYKTPLPIMVLMLLAALTVVAGLAPDRKTEAARGGPRSRSESRSFGILRFLYSTAPLWILWGVYWFFALRSNLNIGHRHLLPTLPPLFILMGAAAGLMRVRLRWVRAAVPAMVVVLAAEAVWMWPHYLAYFNPIAGGPRKAYHHLVDSSLDWGQDLPGLKRWLDEKAAGRTVYLSYFGTSDYKHYDIEARWIPLLLGRTGVGRYQLEPGLYCISATRLQQVYALKQSRWTSEYEREYQSLLPEMRAFEELPNTRAARSPVLAGKDAGFRPRFNRFQKLRFGRLCAYLRTREPDAHVGHSILIWELDQADLDTAQYGPAPGGIPPADGAAPNTAAGR